MDRSLHRNSAQFTFERLGAEEKELVLLKWSGHVITL
jgi:esterase/lipase